MLHMYYTCVESDSMLLLSYPEEANLVSKNLTTMQAHIPVKFRY